jgi:3'-5' exoribonuclease
MLVRELQDGGAVEMVLLVREAESRRRRDGSEYFKLAVGDRTGAVPAILGDEAQRELCVVGDALHVTGQFTRDPRYGGQIVVSRLRAAAAGEYDPADLQDGPPRPVEQLEADLRSLIDTVQDPWLRSLLDGLLGEGTATWVAYREAPAAKRYHQAYRHGLLEHSLSVAEGVSAISATFPGLERDVAVTGALLHDIGKLEAYAATGPAIEMTDAGKLQGEIPLGYYRVRRAIEALPGFPAERAQAVLHIILSHHGSLEHGSPVVPCTREATLVHFLDNLGGRLGSFDRLEKELPDGERWSAFDRVLGSGAYFGAERRAA